MAEGDSDEQSEGKAVLLPRERLNFHKSLLFSSCQVSFYPGSTHTCLKKKEFYDECCLFFDNGAYKLPYNVTSGFLNVSST